MNTNLFPASDLLSREAKEKMLQQRGVALWMTGLSGAGKTSIARSLEYSLNAKGRLTQVLDGDQIRTGINSNLGFTETERMENIRRVAEVARLFVQCGVITICCFVSPAIAMRSKAKEIIGSDDFVEVYVNAPLEVCEQRDVKGLYARARKGEIANFTGIHEAFEPPFEPDIILKSGSASVEACAGDLLSLIEQRNKKYGYL